MGKVTLLVEFEDGKEPAVSGSTEILGGRLSAVRWSDYRDDFFEAGEVDIVREALEEITHDETDSECHEEIIRKMEMLTW